MKQNKKKDLDKKKISKNAPLEDLNDKKHIDETKEQDNNKNKELDIDEIKEENKKLKEDLLRAQAEMQNFKKRIQQEFDNNKNYSTQCLIESLLPILDGFSCALKQVDKDEHIKKFIKGFDMLYKNMILTLEQEGLKKIETENKKFDPYLHQAISQEENKETEDGMILEELQPGYKLKDRVIRASMVKVCKNNKEEK